MTRPALLLTALACLPLTAAAEVTLKHKFVEGDTARYVSESDLTTEVGTPGGRMTTKAKQSQTVTRKVLSVDGDSARVQDTVERIAMDMTTEGGPMKMEISWDSENPDGAKGAQAAMIGGMLSPMIGGTIAYTVSPTGEISDVEVSDAMKATLAATGGGDAETAALSMLDSAFFKLPGGPAKVGDSWSITQTMPSQTGVITMEGPVTVKSVEGDTVTLEADQDASIDAPAGAPMEISMKDSDVKSVTTFDASKGRVVKVRTDATFTMEIKVAGQSQEVTTKVEGTVREAGSGE